MPAAPRIVECRAPTWVPTAALTARTFAFSPVKIPAAAEVFGPILATLSSQLGVRSVLPRCRHCRTPSVTSSAPAAMIAQLVQAGVGPSRPASDRGACINAVVSTASAATRPDKYAMLDEWGRSL